MITITNREVAQASDALMEWFASQGIQPADAALAMSNLIAQQLVGKTKDVIMLQLAVDNIRTLLMLDIALHFRKE